MSKPARSAISAARTNCAAHLVHIGPRHLAWHLIVGRPGNGRRPHHLPVAARAAARPSSPSRAASSPWGRSARAGWRSWRRSRRGRNRRCASRPASCSGAYRPVQPGVMRPSGDTQVISVKTSPAPPLARSARCTKCQSVGVPSTARYCAIGETTIRFFRRRSRRRNGVNIGGRAAVRLARRSPAPRTTSPRLPATPCRARADSRG